MSSEPLPEPAGSVVADRLVEMVDELARHDSQVRRRATGGVHGLRVTVRRSRSLLATFGSDIDPDTVTALRADLKWVSGELGAARDAEVVRERVTSLAATEAEEALAGRITEQLERTASRGASDVVDVLDSDRYSRTLKELTAFATTADLRAPLDEALLRRRVRRDWKRVRRRVEVAARTTDEADRQQALHEVRKAARRLRYSAEALGPLHGKDAVRLAKRAKSVQSALGELQDSIVVRVRLRGLIDRPGWTTREGFLLGVFHEREAAQATIAEESYAHAWQRLSRKKHRRWLG